MLFGIREDLEEPRDVHEILAHVHAVLAPVHLQPARQGSGFRVQSSGFRVQGSGFRVRVQSLVRIQGSGFTRWSDLLQRGSWCSQGGKLEPFVELIVSHRLLPITPLHLDVRILLAEAHLLETGDWGVGLIHLGLRVLDLDSHAAPRRGLETLARLSHRCFQIRCAEVNTPANPSTHH